MRPAPGRSRPEAEKSPLPCPLSHGSATHSVEAGPAAATGLPATRRSVGARREAALPIYNRRSRACRPHAGADLDMTPRPKASSRSASIFAPGARPRASLRAGSLLAGLLLALLTASPALSQRLETATPSAEDGSASVEGGAADAVDVVFVLDNSGSMKENDPDFLTRAAVRDFARAIAERPEVDARLGVVIFDEDARLVRPLAPLPAAAPEAGLERGLATLDFSGQRTNSPAGIERALYELRRNGRDAARQAIVLLSDGRIDTGDRARDLEANRWLREDLAGESASAGVRIFGVAFTEDADYPLMQALARRTSARYYRAFAPAELASVVDDVLTRVSEARFYELATLEADPQAMPPSAEPRPEPGAAGTEGIDVASGPTPEDDDGVGLLGVLPVLALLVGGALLYVGRARLAGEARPAAVVAAASDAPRAQLLDVGGQLGKAGKALPVGPGRTRIGRDEKNDLVIPDDTISSEHAVIEYRDGRYWLEDLRSTNGTRLGDERLSGDRPVPLKGGDHVRFADVDLMFVLPGYVPGGATVFLSSSSSPPADWSARAVDRVRPPKPPAEVEPARDGAAERPAARVARSAEPSAEAAPQVVAEALPEVLAEASPEPVADAASDAASDAEMEAAPDATAEAPPERGQVEADPQAQEVFAPEPDHEPEAVARDESGPEAAAATPDAELPLPPLEAEPVSNDVAFVEDRERLDPAPVVDLDPQLASVTPIRPDIATPVTPARPAAPPDAEDSTDEAREASTADPVAVERDAPEAGDAAEPGADDASPADAGALAAQDSEEGEDAVADASRDAEQVEAASSTGDGEAASGPDDDPARERAAADLVEPADGGALAAAADRYRPCLDYHLDRVAEIAPPFEAFVERAFDAELRDAIAVAAAELMEDARGHDRIEQREYTHDGTRYLVLAIPDEMAAARDRFAASHGGFTRLLTEQLQSESFTTDRCRTLAVVSFGQGEAGPWVSLSIVPEEGEDPRIDLLSYEFLSETERREIEPSVDPEISQSGLA